MRAQGRAGRHRATSRIHNPHNNHLPSPQQSPSPATTVPSPAGRERARVRARGRAGAFRSSHQFFRNCAENAVDILEYIRIPKPHHPVSSCLQPSRSNEIISFQCVNSVLTTIDLYDQFCLITDEIDDVMSHGLLPPEFRTTQPTIPQLAPERSFGRGHVSTQSSSAYNNVFFLVPDIHSSDSVLDPTSFKSTAWRRQPKKRPRVSTGALSFCDPLPLGGRGSTCGFKPSYGATVSPSGKKTQMPWPISMPSSPASTR